MLVYKYALVELIRPKSSVNTILKWIIIKTKLIKLLIYYTIFSVEQKKDLVKTNILP